MSTTAVATARANLPAHLQKAVASREAVNEFAGGVQSGFPVISIRGKAWRVREKGEEHVALDANGDALQSIEVVLVRSNPVLSKTYYEGRFKEGSDDKPRCWSATGVKPDPNVDNPISATCAGCPMNVWGSRTTEAGKKTRACADVRRVATTFIHELEAVASGEKALEDIPVYLLRIPAATLNPLKEFVEKKLAPKGLDPWMLSTRLGFDTEVAYPKITFKPGRFLSEDEFNAVLELRDSDTVKRILNESAEHDVVAQGDGGPTDKASEAASSQPAAKAETVASAPPELSEEQHSQVEEDDEIAPPPAPARAAAVEAQSAASDNDDDDEIAPAPPAKDNVVKLGKASKKPKPATKAQKSAAEPAPVESPDSDGDGDDFDAMLDSILE